MRHDLRCAPRISLNATPRAMSTRALGADRMPLRRRTGAGADPTRLAAVGVAVVMHALLFAALWQYAPLRETVLDAIPVLVTFSEPRPEPPVVPKPAVKPRAASSVPPPKAPPALTRPPSVDAAPPTAPREAVAEPATPAVPNAPAPTVVEAPVAVVPAPAPQSVPPRFDADYLQNPPPVYPAMSRRSGERGRVLLHVFVDADGRAAKVEVRTSSGFERLDAAALDAVSQWRFVPARLGTQSVAAWVLVPISFSLKG